MYCITRTDHPNDHRIQEHLSVHKLQLTHNTPASPQVDDRSETSRFQFQPYVNAKPQLNTAHPSTRLISTHRRTLPLDLRSRRKDDGPCEHAAPAAGYANTQLCTRSVDRVYALEGTLRRLRLALAHRRRAVWLHGACL